MNIIIIITLISQTSPHSSSKDAIALQDVTSVNNDMSTVQTLKSLEDETVSSTTNNPNQVPLQGATLNLIPNMETTQDHCPEKNTPPLVLPNISVSYHEEGPTHTESDQSESGPTAKVIDTDVVKALHRDSQ